MTKPLGNKMENCDTCGIEVKDRDKGIQCEVCMKWWHIKCLNIKAEKYKFLKDDNIAWYCDNCKVGGKKLRNQMILMQQRLDEYENRLKRVEDNMVTKAELTACYSDNLNSEATKSKIKEIATEVQADTQQDTMDPSAVRAAIHDWAAEQQDIDRRETNLIFYKLKEPEGTKEEMEKSDKDKILQIAKTIHPAFEEKQIKETIRLGQKKDDTNRPILVKFEDKTDARNLLKNANKLKDSTWDISIAADLPKEARKYRSKLIEEAKRKTQSIADKSFLYKVVGEPGKERIVKTKKKE